MQHQIEKLKQQFFDDLQKISTTVELEDLKVKFLGKKGAIQEFMKELKNAAPVQRPHFGKLINELKDEISATLSDQYTILLRKEEDQQIAQEKIDITLPGRTRYPGRKHIINLTLDEMIDAMSEMGFSVQYGPDIDTDYYNFEALNFAPDHPARDMQDTFYLAPNVLLRTHTSNIQTRIMELQRPPIRITAPGTAYRNETITARSHVFFHQVEALYIDVGVTFSDLQATLKEFIAKIFKEPVELRFRPSYFPFVEPGMEVDMRCLSCKKGGCPLCKYTGWLEIAGAGMVHPEVLKNGDINPEIYTGYAWGMGVERLAMLKHGINDIRLFSDNDFRFLEQFKG